MSVSKPLASIKRIFLPCFALPYLTLNYDLFFPDAGKAVVFALFPLSPDSEPISRSSSPFGRWKSHLKRVSRLPSSCKVLSQWRRPNCEFTKLTVLLRLNTIHTTKVRSVVSVANGRYHHQAGLLLSTSTFIPKRLYEAQLGPIWCGFPLDLTAMNTSGRNMNYSEVSLKKAPYNGVSIP